MMQKIIHLWGMAEEIIVVTLLGLASYLTFQEVILRYVFGTGWSGSYEITVMSLIWCTFFGVSLGVRENIHIGVDLLVKKFDPSIQRILIIIAILCSVLFGIIVAIKGFEFAQFISRSKLLSRDLRIPMEIGYMAVPVGGVLLSARFIERLVSVLKGRTIEADRMHELSEEDKKKLIRKVDR
ncbi:MAG: TRAP transporter small permease [Deltaproteobacteria bacterium]|nr:TRAP transporter small permease [Deltaproteobacteria bacterium]MBW1995154.1 TRAP transporter small permease [Deltaproteobacteria bacterium]MBW2150115.1 TRAP transporter small permease [Deltaproteobacteria bacterium]